MKNNPALSICIPTWNRAHYLNLSLEQLAVQVKDIDSNEIEIFISDNASSDNTPEIVSKYISDGMPIAYYRNSENIGAARNFLSCMNKASGKYIILLGDDDLLLPGSLKYILDLIRYKDYGLIHLQMEQTIARDFKEYSNKEDFFKIMSYWVTFMSGCIFLKEAIGYVKEPEKYINTHLLQVPFYIQSACLREKNLIIGKKILQGGLDTKNNGGYNFYEVFITNYLNIWKYFLSMKIISNSCYKLLKKDIYNSFIIYYNFTLLFLKQNVAEQSLEYKSNRKGFKINGAWKILQKTYGKEFYFYISFFKIIYLYIKYILKKCYNFYICKS